MSRNSLDFVKMLLFLPIIFPVFPRGMAKIFPGERGAQILKFPGIPRDGIPRGPPLNTCITLQCLKYLSQLGVSKMSHKSQLINMSHHKISQAKPISSSHFTNSQSIQNCPTFLATIPPVSLLWFSSLPLSLAAENCLLLDQPQRLVSSLLLSVYVCGHQQTVT